MGNTTVVQVHSMITCKEAKGKCGPSYEIMRMCGSRVITGDSFEIDNMPSLLFNGKLTSPHQL